MFINTAQEGTFFSKTHFEETIVDFQREKFAKNFIVAENKKVSYFCTPIAAASGHAENMLCRALTTEKHDQN